MITIFVEQREALFFSWARILISKLQSWAKYLEQNREPSKTVQEKKVDIYFCVFFDRYCLSLISGRGTGHWAMFPPKFEIILIFPYFLRSVRQLMRQLVYQVCYTRYRVSFYFRFIGSAQKHCKVPKYYDQDCRS